MKVITRKKISIEKPQSRQACGQMTRINTLCGKGRDTYSVFDSKSHEYVLLIWSTWPWAEAFQKNSLWRKGRKHSDGANTTKQLNPLVSVHPYRFLMLSSIDIYWSFWIRGVSLSTKTQNACLENLSVLSYMESFAFYWRCDANVGFMENLFIYPNASRS